MPLNPISVRYAERGSAVDFANRYMAMGWIVRGPHEVPSQDGDLWEVSAEPTRMMRAVEGMQATGRRRRSV